MDLLIVWLLNGFALMIVAYLLKGVHIENYFSAFIAAAVLALVNTLVKPVLVILTIPITIDFRSFLAGNQCLFILVCQ